MNEYQKEKLKKTAPKVIDMGYGSCIGLKEWAKKEYGDVQVWYTERNGDPIFCILPIDADPEADLPDFAMCYVAFEWIDPDKDFGTGIKPVRRK